MKFELVRLGDFFLLEKGASYTSANLVGKSDVGLLTINAFNVGGGYKSNSEKPFSGPVKDQYMLSEGDVLVAMTEQDSGLLASPLVVKFDQTEFKALLYSLDVAKVSSITEEISARFLFNVLRIPAFRRRAAYGDTGSTVQRLPYEALYDLRIPKPPLRVQNAIVHLIDSIDEKMRMNQQIAGHLEKIAQTIFKSWFIDFDPVKAKMAGEKPAGMDATTAALFPDSLEETELGLIPTGWLTSKLGNHLKVTKGTSYKSSELKQSDTALVTLKSFKRGGGYRYDGLKSFSGEFKPEQVVGSGDLIVSFTDVTQAADVIGKPAIVLTNPAFSTLVASLDVGIVRTTSRNLGKNYLYQLFSTPIFKNHIDGYTNGTTVLHLGKGALEDFIVPLPGETLMTKYESFASSIISKIQMLYLENLSLEQIRDSLLPRLISGELQIPQEMLTS